MTRDFRAEAVEAKKQAKQHEQASFAYRVPVSKYPFRVKPEGMTDEQWRHECEIRWVMCGLPNAEQRRRYLAAIEEKRGPEARKKIEGEVLRLWQTRNQA